MKTFSAKPSDVHRQWHLVDASEAPVGRVAATIATLLTGKAKPIFTAHIDCGDYVVVINTDKIVVTGKKLTDKKYYRHSGYPGNLKEMTLAEKMAADSTDVLRLAVKGMLPKNKLTDQRLQRLRIFAGEDHSHSAQSPKKVSLKK